MDDIDMVGYGKMIFCCKEFCDAVLHDRVSHAACIFLVFARS
jgi:hypothetical protein